MGNSLRLSTGQFWLRTEYAEPSLLAAIPRTTSRGSRFQSIEVQRFNEKIRYVIRRLRLPESNFPNE